MRWLSGIGLWSHILEENSWGRGAGKVVAEEERKRQRGTVTQRSQREEHRGHKEEVNECKSLRVKPCGARTG